MSNIPERRFPLFCWKNQAVRAFFCGLLFFLCTFSAFGFEPRSMNLEKGWEYRWGDSPALEGKPLWATEGLSEGQPSAWKSIGFPSNPPERNGQNNVWYRIPLPDQEELGSSLYIFSIDLIAEVYFEGERIYHYGTFKPDGSGEFQGWPWHIITLPRDYPGKFLYFRVYSDYPDIGLWGKVVLGNEGHHIQEIIQGDLIRVTVGVFFVFFGILVLALALYRLSNRLLFMGLFLINLGIMPIHTSHVKQLILHAPILWQYIGAGNYFLLPVAMAALLAALYGKGPRKIYQWIIWVHLVFFFYAMAAPLAGMVNLSSTYIHFDIIALVTMFSLSLSLHLQARKGTVNQKLLTFGFWVMYGIMVYNGLIAHDFLPFAASSEFVGPMFLAFCFGVILHREYNELKSHLKQRTAELEELNQTLELRIDERTKALQVSNQTKDQFFAIIAHDLKGPIGSLSSLFEQFAASKAGMDATTIENLSSGVTHIYQLLENLLTWAQSQRGELVAEPKRFDVNEIIVTTAKVFQEAAESKNIQIQFERGESHFVFADVSMIATVVRNLMNNAVKFTDREGKIQVEISEEGDFLKVACIDTGIGMTTRQMENLFTVNDQQLRLTGTAGERGTGLGLILCSEFVTLNKGKIGVKSKLGEGSTLWFKIPKG